MEPEFASEKEDSALEASVRDKAERISLRGFTVDPVTPHELTVILGRRGYLGDHDEREPVKKGVNLLYLPGRSESVATPMSWKRRTSLWEAIHVAAAKTILSVSVRGGIILLHDSGSPRITDPPDGIFQCGIAYPIEARIDGTGAGAVRHCVFSTGAFVEPITRWEEPTLLGFDVASSPPPMRELSLYEHVDAPHLHGHMESKRGQFRLTERDGAVVLEGTTWYTHTLSPQWDRGPISDYMIHCIHERVLNHIKRISERK